MKITGELLLLQLASAAPILSTTPSSAGRGPHTIVLKEGAYEGVRPDDRRGRLPGR